MLTNIAWMIYLADVVENAGKCIGVIVMFILCYVGWVVLVKVMFNDDKHMMNMFGGNSLTKPIVSAVVLLIVGVLLPSKNTIYIAAGAVATDEVIKKISENKEVNIIKDKVITLVNKKLDEAIVDSKVEGGKK